MLAIGETAPEFALPGPGGQVVRLSEQLRDGAVVVYFYPADFTPGCTAQACMLRDARDDLLEAGYRVIGISPQTVESHERFDDKHKLGLVLLADPEREVIKAYGASGVLGMVRRVTYVVGQDGVVVDRVAADLRVGKHRELVERLLKG